MARIPKTAFISYRRTNQAHAIKIYQLLQELGYDPFLDVKDLGAGAWRVLIQREIQRRAHFIMLLTPSAVERFAEPNDVMRFEIETAIESKRNLVPLMFDGFNYSDPRIHDYLTGKLSILSEYNAFPINWRRLKKDIQDLIDRFLSVHPDDVVHPMLDDLLIAQPEAEEARFGASEERQREERKKEALSDAVIGEEAESVGGTPPLTYEEIQATALPVTDIYPSEMMPSASPKKSASAIGGIFMAILTSPVWLVYKIRDWLSSPQAAKQASDVDKAPIQPARGSAPPPPPPAVAPAPLPQAPGEALEMNEAQLLLLMREAMANLPSVSDDELALEEAKEQV